MANSKCISDQVPTLLAGGCPDWLAELELAQLRLRNFRQNRWDVLEFFSGHGRRHRACQTAGGRQEDLHYLGGLEAAIDRVLEVRRHRLVWFTPPCSWWTYLASPNHKRSSENQYVPKCTSRLANSLALVAAALVQLCASLGLAAAMEQLSDSCLFFFRLRAEKPGLHSGLRSPNFAVSLFRRNSNPKAFGTQRYLQMAGLLVPEQIQQEFRARAGFRPRRTPSHAAIPKGLWRSCLALRIHFCIHPCVCLFLSNQSSTRRN